jgi:hypothetical protein
MKKLTKTQLNKINSLHDKAAIENLKIQNIERERTILELKQELYKSQIALLSAEAKNTVNRLKDRKNKREKVKQETKEEIEKIG